MEFKLIYPVKKYRTHQSNLLRHFSNRILKLLVWGVLFWVLFACLFVLCFLVGWLLVGWVFFCGTHTQKTPTPDKLGKMQLLLTVQ